MERQIVSEYKSSVERGAAETLALADTSKAQLVASGSLTRERRLVVIDTWARALGGALRNFDDETGKLASAQIAKANKVLKTGLDREMFWGALLACLIAGSEEDNGDILVAMAAFEYLRNFAEWGYGESLGAGISPSELGNAFQWVPAPWIPQARQFIESWVSGAPEDKRPAVFAEIAFEVDRIQKSVSQWSPGLRQATLAVAAEWARRGASSSNKELPA